MQQEHSTSGPGCGLLIVAIVLLCIGAIVGAGLLWTGARVPNPGSTSSAKEGHALVYVATKNLGREAFDAMVIEIDALIEKSVSTPVAIGASSTGTGEGLFGGTESDHFTEFEITESFDRDAFTAALETIVNPTAGDTLVELRIEFGDPK